MGKSIPKRSRNTDDMALDTIAFGLDKLEKGVTGREVYYCTKCNQRISFDTNSQPPLVCKRCAAHRVDEIRDEIVPPLQLHVDLAPPVQHLIAQADQPVVARDRPHGDQRR